MSRITKKQNEIWKIGTNVNSYIKNFKTLLENYKGQTFSFDYKNEKKILFLDHEKNEINIYEKFISDSTIQQALAIWISLGIVEFTNKNLVFPLTKKDLLKQEYKIQLDNYDHLEFYVNKYFEENKMPFFKDFLNAKEEVQEQTENTVTDDVLAIWKYNGENNTFYSLFMAQIYEKDKNIFTLMHKGASDGEDRVKYWINLGIQFNDYWWEIAEKFIPKNIVLDNRESNFYKENYSCEYKEITETIANYKKIMEQRERKNVEIIDAEIIDANTQNVLLFLEFLKTQNTIIKIPIYQREYRWKNDTFGNLINDILKIGDGNDKKHHYIAEAALLLKEKSDEIRNLPSRYNLIDGQQRITSLLIFWRALYSYCYENNKKTSKWAHDFFKIENGENIISKKFKHIDGNNDSKTFRNVILGNNKIITNDKEQKNSNIYKNFCYAYEFFQTQKFDFETLKKIEINFLTKIIFTMIRHGKNDEFILFENLNSNKVKLENIDLLKNYIMMRVEDNLIDKRESEILTYFDQKILKPFRDAKSEEKINLFFKIHSKLHLLEKNENINSEMNATKNEYKYLKNAIEDQINAKIEGNSNKMNKAQYESFINDINKNIELFLTISCRDEYGDKIFKNIQDILYCFKDREVYYPTLMYIIIKNLEYKDGKQIFKNLNKLRSALFALEKYEIIVFQIIASRGKSLLSLFDRFLVQIKINYDKNPNSLNYEDIMKIGSMPEFDNTYLKWQNYYLEEFKKILSKQPIKENKVVNILCKRLEFYIYNTFSMKLDGTENSENHKIKNVSREHIMPRSYKSHWGKDIYDWNPMSKNSVEEQHAMYLDYIGNSIGINSTKNTEFGNASFSDKKEKYANSSAVNNLLQYSGTKGKNSLFTLMAIEDIDYWSFKKIEERSLQIAEILTHLYKEFK